MKERNTVMTFIASATGYSVLTLSDLLVSGSVDPGVQIKGLPVSPSAFNLSTPNHTILGLVQKTVVLDADHLLQWAGKEVVARVVARELCALLSCGWDGHLHEAIAKCELSASEMEAISMIYHRWDGPLVHKEAWNANENLVDGQNVISAGTGKFHFLDSIVPTFSGASNSEEMIFLRGWLHRIGMGFFLEAHGFDTITYAYGGWFELALVADARLKKIPYLIKLWSLRDNGVDSLPCFSSWYAGADLCIGRTDLKADLDKSTLDVTVVRDFLRREDARTRAEYLDTFTPAGFQIHVVFDDRIEGNLRFGIVPVEAQEGEFSLTVADGRVHWHVEATLLPRLLAALGGDSQGTIEFPYD